MLSAIAIEAVYGHHDRELLAGLGSQGKTHGNGDTGVHFFGTGFGVVVRNEVLLQWSFM